MLALPIESGFKRVQDEFSTAANITRASSLRNRCGRHNRTELLRLYRCLYGEESSARSRHNFTKILTLLLRFVAWGPCMATSTFSVHHFSFRSVALNPCGEETTTVTGGPKFLHPDHFFLKILVLGPRFSAKILVPGPNFPGPFFHWQNVKMEQPKRSTEKTFAYSKGCIQIGLTCL